MTLAGRDESQSALPSLAYLRLVRLQRVSAQLSAARTTHQVADVVLDELAEAAGAAGASLFLLAPDGTTARVAASRGFDDEVTARWSSFDVGAEVPAAHSLRTGEAVLLRSRTEVLERYPTLAQDIAQGSRQALASLPLVADGLAFGAIGLGFDDERPFDEDETRFLTSLALLCAVAFDRARAYEAEAEARATAEAAWAQLSFLAEASALLASSLDWEDTLRRVAELAVPVLADWCIVHLVVGDQLRPVKVAHPDPDKRAATVALREHHRPSLDDPVGVGAVVRTGVGVVVPEVDDTLLATVATSAEHRESAQALDMSSMIIVPLCVGTRVLGTLSLITGDERRLGDDDLLVAGELATSAGQAIANAQLFKERADVARTLQATLLPPAMPTIPGLEVASRFAPGSDGVVGGDFFDVFPAGAEGHGGWHVVIGDVRGKGVEAAALTGVARNTIRSAAIDEPSPAQLLGHLNDVLIRSDVLAGAEDGDPRFCTMVVGTILPLPNGIAVELAVAGHPLPFLLRADGTTEQVGERGTLLGVVAQPSLVDSRVELHAGDALVLYTDGITERHAGDRFFEEEGLAKVLARCAGFTAATVAERIETAARAFVDGEPRDDLALLVVRVPERPASTTSASTDLPAHPLSARRARRFVLTALDAFAVRGIDEEAELLTSELVTNAVIHAHSGVRISVEDLDDGVKISVSDTDPLIPTLGAPVDDAEHGRGLHLVDMLATRWGVEPTESGKTVWFELRGDRRKPH